ncbi:hypothetical protein [Dyella ginsengisoli]|uniref:hypothetical protein n=1 Tax=Dyella ginsengisoli TaxID=363848 RepID=UPI00034B5267|nr:hypothetical protein [Dyella ginsengisoli]
MSLTHGQLCQIGARWLRGRGRCPIVLTEFACQLTEQPDVLGLRNAGQDSLLIEAKASRSDFLADKRKPHRSDRAIEALGSYRWYLCEPDVIRVQDLPERWGLLYASRNRVQLIAGADPDRHYWPAETDVWRWPAGAGELTVMFSVLRRLQLQLGAEAFREASHRRLMVTPKPSPVRDPRATHTRYAASSAPSSD